LRTILPLKEMVQLVFSALSGCSDAHSGMTAPSPNWAWEGEKRPKAGLGVFDV